MHFDRETTPAWRIEGMTTWSVDARRANPPFKNGLHGPRKIGGTGHRESVHERLRYEIADQGAVVTSLQRCCLHHQYGYQLLFRVNPKSRTPYTSPIIFSG